MLALRITASPAEEDLVTAVLWELGTTGIETREGPDGVTFLAYFSEGADLAAIEKALTHSVRVESADVPEVDWVARFREGFRAFDVGGFRIAPPWDRPSDPAGRRVIVVDPGRAFGTGTHESTRLCLALLEERARRGPIRRVLDVGTGTGILAVASGLLGARCVVGIDIDTDAVESARLHSRLNGLALHLLRGDGGRPLASGVFDVVLANLTAPLLLEKRDEILALRAPGAELILAGILGEEALRVRHAYEVGGVAQIRFDGDWAAILLRPRTP